MNFHRYRFIPAVALLLWYGAMLSGQTIIVRSFAEPSTIGKDEQVTYTIEVTGDKGFKATAPKLPNLTDFSMLSMMTSSSSDYAIINGSVSESVTKSFIYRLLPRKTGSLKIPSFSFAIGSRYYTTQTVNVRVLDLSRAGSKQPQQGNSPGSGQSNPFQLFNPFDFNQGFEPIGDMEILAAPDKKSVFVGEPVLVTYRLYTNQPVSSLELKEEKDFGGYGKEVYSESQRLNFEAAHYKDQRYRVSVLKTVAISPNRAGTIQLPQLTANVQVGSMGLYSQTLQSQAAFITVRELPAAGKPGTFSGAVGSFKVGESIGKTILRIGEAVEYKLAISGRGNFNQFSNPEYPVQQDFRIASPITANSIQAGITGKRSITYLLIPKHEGSFSLPGVSFNWFDPVSGSYQGFHSAPRSITVKPGNVLTYISNVFQKENIRSLTPFQPRSSYKSQPILIASTWYWLAVLLMLLSLLPSWLLARRSKLKEVDPELAAQRGSNQVLKKYLKQAEAAARVGSQDFYPKAEQGLMRYLSDKYHVSHRYSTAEKIYQLRLKGLDYELIDGLEAFLKRCQEARYMPGGFNESVLDDDLEALTKVIKTFISQPGRLNKTPW
jgi:hypothetical protein